MTPTKKRLIDNNASLSLYSGIRVYESDANTFINNSAISNGDYGVYLRYSDYNHIFNNYFNNTENSCIYSSSDNSWNTQKSPGPNIAGGPCIGGNLWAKPDGTGFSQTHNDTDGDGLCEEYYDPGEGNIDYLPLTTPQVLNLPVANFTSSVNEGIEPLTVQFTDLSRSRQPITSLAWLANNTYPNALIEWETDKWGEIRADFGRK